MWEEVNSNSTTDDGLYDNEVIITYDGEQDLNNTSNSNMTLNNSNQVKVVS